MNRASICKINELEGQLERLSRTGLTVDVFRNAMRKAPRMLSIVPTIRQKRKRVLTEIRL